MITFIRAGGISMFIVILFGIITLIAAGLFTWKLRESLLGFFRGMVTATLYSILGGISANLATVMWRVSQDPEWGKSPDMKLIVMTGIAESLTPAILGFTIISLAWMIVAFGNRRFYARSAE